MEICKKIRGSVLLLSIISSFYSTSSYGIELDQLQPKKLETCTSHDISYNKKGLIFYGTKVEPGIDGDSYVVKQGNNLEKDIVTNFGTSDYIIENSNIYENFPENKDVMLAFGYPTGGVCCNEYIILTKKQNGVYGNIINSGRVELSFASVNNKPYMLIPISDFTSGESGAGFMPYPLKVMVFENGNWQYGKIGEHKDVYEKLLIETQNKIDNKLKNKNKKELDIEQDLIFPAVEIAFYKTMLGVDKKIILDDLAKILPKNKKKLAAIYFKEATKNAENNVQPADNRPLFKK